MEILINWRAIGDDDFIADAGAYTLRVEAMDEELWWWVVWHEGRHVSSGHCPGETHKEAKRLAERCFRHHSMPEQGCYCCGMEGSIGPNGYCLNCGAKAAETCPA
jgi:hypothetical protein